MQWNPNDFYDGTGRTPTGRIAAVARDKQDNIVASTAFESVNFDCGGF